MGRKIIIEKDKLYECPACGYRWKDECDLSFDEGECVPCCPDCGELIEDGSNGAEYENGEYKETRAVELTTVVELMEVLKKLPPKTKVYAGGTNGYLHIVEDEYGDKAVSFDDKEDI